jgi:hypothetical protein
VRIEKFNIAKIFVKNKLTEGATVSSPCDQNGWLQSNFGKAWFFIGPRIGYVFPFSISST